MHFFATLKEQALAPVNSIDFSRVYRQVEHIMGSEPLLAHLIALNGCPKQIPKFFRVRGVNEESLLYFKWQLLCFRDKIPEPRLFSYPCIFFERNEGEIYWRWLRSAVVSIVREAPPCCDPRFNPLAIYWGARYIDSLTSDKTIKLVC